MEKTIKIFKPSGKDGEFSLEDSAAELGKIKEKLFLNIDDSVLKNIMKTVGEFLEKNYAETGIELKDYFSLIQDVISNYFIVGSTEENTDNFIKIINEIKEISLKVYGAHNPNFKKTNPDEIYALVKQYYDKKEFVYHPIAPEDEIFHDWTEKHLSCFWTHHELDFSQDKFDYQRLSSEEKLFIKKILAFFSSSDGIIAKYMGSLTSEIKNHKAAGFYKVQALIEHIHSVTYSLMIEEYVKNPREKEMILDAVSNYDEILYKTGWIFKWMDPKVPFVRRLFAFAIIEGVFFASSFCLIYWLKEKNLMPGLSKANEFISRDETMHWQYATVIYKHYCLPRGLKLTQEEVDELMKSAIELEINFIQRALPLRLIGMNSSMMIEYVKHCSNLIMEEFGFVPYFKDIKNPFPFMNHFDLENKTNFFEKRATDYHRATEHKAIRDSYFDTDKMEF